MAGNIGSAMLLVSSDPLVIMNNMSVRDPDVLLSLEARALVWAGRGEEAARRTNTVLQALSEQMLVRPGGFRLALARIEALLAVGDIAGVRIAAERLISTMERANATKSWTYRSLIETLALATARQGDRATARALLAGIDASPTSPAAPSVIDNCESMLRRAQLFKLLGEQAESQAAARAALVDLAVQHSSSPRLLLARELMAGDASDRRKAHGTSRATP
jgi:ABC-type branched-subunit amino acid transport system ATPase component